MTQTMNRTTVTTPRDREIRIERVFDAPRERVWQAHTDPALVAQWWGRGHVWSTRNAGYGTGFRTTVTVMAEGYRLEWWTMLRATTPSFSS